MSTETFQVQGMSCGHCVKAVTQAIEALDASAQVHIDLPSGRVEVQSQYSRDVLKRAIAEEGYTVA